MFRSAVIAAALMSGAGYAHAQSRDIMQYEPGAVVTSVPGGFQTGLQALDASSETFWQPRSLQGELTRYFEAPHSIQRIEIEAGGLNSVSVAVIPDFGEEFKVVAEHYKVTGSRTEIDLKGVSARAIKIHFYGKDWPSIHTVRAISSDSVEVLKTTGQASRKANPTIATIQNWTAWQAWGSQTAIHENVESLGWSRADFGNDQWESALKRLDAGDFDMLLVGPMFTLPSELAMRQRVLKSLRSFAESGGVAIFFGVQKAEQADWLGEIDLHWRLRAGMAGLGENTGIPVHIDVPQSPLMSAPYEIKPWGAPYGHIMLNSEGWDELATDPEGYGALVQRRIGKGAFVMAANDCDQVPLRNLLANISAWQQANRSGIVLKSLQWPQFQYGLNKVEGKLVNQTAQAASLSLLLDNGSAKSSVNVVLAPGEVRKFQVPVTLTKPGKGRGVFSVLRTSGREAIQRFVSRDYLIPEPLTLELVAPRYRNAVYSSDPDQNVKIAARVTPVTADAQLLLELVDGKGVTLRKLPGQKVTAVQPNVQQTFNVATLTPGTYKVRASLNAGSAKATQAEVSFVKVAPSHKEVILDRYGRTLINGKPFLPLAVYRIPKDKLGEYASLGFNTVIASEGYDRSFLDDAAKANLKVLPVTWGDTAKCREYMDHPALLAWYLSDEPSGRRAEHPSTQIDQYEEYKKIDPYHPVLIVDNAIGEHIRACDISAPDVYPFSWSDKYLTNHSIWEVAHKYDMLNADPSLAGHGLWRVPGVFTQAPSVYYRTSKRQIWADAYGSLCLGAKGLLWYSYSSPEDPQWNLDQSAMKPWLGELSTELTKYSDVLLSVEKTPDIRVSTDGARLISAVRTQGKNDYVIAVNWQSNPMTKVVTFADKRTTTAVDERTGQKIAVKNGQMLLSLEPLQVAVVRCQKPYQ